jgi:hypothetical protein
MDRSNRFHGFLWALFWTYLMFAFYRYVPPVNMFVNQLNPCAKVRAEGNYFRGL